MRRYFLICSVLFLLLFTACKVDNLVSQGTVRFNPNGGSGYMTAQTVFAGQPQKLYTNAYSRDNYFFIGWNTQKDGAGTFFKENDTYTYDGKEPELNLYAQWKKNEGTYSIYFVDLMNGYEEKVVEVGCGEEYSLPDIKEIFDRDNVFLEWDTSSDGSGDIYANKAVVKDLVQAGSRIYLYARWAITITYNMNGGSIDTPIDDIIVKSLDKVSLYSDSSEMTYPSVPEDLYDPPLNDKFYPGYVFRGWCTDPNGCEGTVYLKKDGKVEGIAPAKDTTLYALWGYDYHTDEAHQHQTNVFLINASSFVRHCEQLPNDYSKAKKQDIADYMSRSNCVVLATGPLYSVESIAGQEKGELITKKISNNSRYCYVVWDNEKDTYACLELYSHPENYIWKDEDTDVLVIAELVNDSSLSDITSPSKDYMSSWGNPTIREPGDQVDPIIFRTLFPSSAPYAPEYIFSSTGKDGFPGEYYNVATYVPVGSGFWSAREPEENCNMVMTARF